MDAAGLDACCKILEDRMEYSGDELLVRLVKIQQLEQSISVAMAPENVANLQQLPLTMVLQSFQRQLEAFKSTLSPNLQHHREFPLAFKD